MIQHESFLRHQQTSNWRSKRYAALEKAGFACQSCGQGHLQAVLEVCPRTGSQPTEVADAPELVVLCKACQQSPGSRRIAVTAVCQPAPTEAPAESAPPVARTWLRPAIISLAAIAIIIPLVALAVS